MTASSDNRTRELLKRALDVNRLAAAYLEAETRLDRSTVDPVTKKSAETFLNYTRTALEENKIYVGKRKKLTAEALLGLAKPGADCARAKPVPGVAGASH